MAYKVFISHSTKDQGLVMALANTLSKFAVDVYVAEWYLTPGEHIEKKVFTQIDNADCIVLLLTGNGIRSNWVHQEIGYAKKAGKPLIPLVEKGVKDDLGVLGGREYIEYNPSEPLQALNKTSIYVKNLKLKKDDRNKALLVSGGIIAFLLLLSGGGQE